ncbi:hypothetical protein ACHAWF_009634 [Thalassiosira exigua]
MFATTHVLALVAASVAVGPRALPSAAGFSPPPPTLGLSSGWRWRTAAPALLTDGPPLTATVAGTRITRKRRRMTTTTVITTTTSLPMGLLDFVKENFLSSREGDFVPLDRGDDESFGPGPLVLMYAVPSSMDDDEIWDMVEDGMPRRDGGSVIVRRIAGMDADGSRGDALLDRTVGGALDEAMAKGGSRPSGDAAVNPSAVESIEGGPCPVLYFSGVTNAEMMETYRIVANEIYEETGGVHWPACAKVVRPAMEKSLRQVLTEISGDHADSMRMRREESEEAERG